MHDTLKVLFVEDSQVDVDLARRALAQDGMQIDWRCVATERGLLAALADFEPHVVLCDYRLCGYSGSAALDLVRSSCPSTPVLLLSLSGFMEESAAIRFLDNGATDYISKSNLSRLGTAVRRAVAEAQGQARTREAEQSQRLSSEVLEASLDMIMLSDLNGRITFVNEAARQLLGVAPNQFIGSNMDEQFDTQSSQSSQSARNEILNCALQKGCWRGEVSMIKGNGKQIVTSQVVTVHRDSDGTPHCFSAIAHDLSDRMSSEALIHRLSHYDTLTGLPNLAHMATLFASAVSGTRSVLLAVAIININEFRLVDEVLGRLSSDVLLQQVGATLQVTAGPRNSVARVGPDEFMILVTDINTRAAVGRLMKRILAAIAAPRNSHGQDLQFTASGGVALYPGDGDGLRSLHNKASSAMHESKNSGPGQWRFHRRCFQRKAADRLSLETGLRNAIRNGELSVAFQTQYNIQDGLACGVEALARWRRSDGESVAPAVFVPLAESMKLIGALGAWVLQNACSTVAGWDCPAESKSVVCVNISTQQIDAELFPLVSRVLESSGLQPSRLELEITESILMIDGPKVLNQLDRLRQLGVRIAMDDFGAGFSSLGYLSRLPVDRLKIDRSLVHGLAPGARAADIVRAVIDLGNKFGFMVLAEGVETEDELELLGKLGCRQAQGFLLSRPVRASLARRLLNTRWGDYCSRSSRAASSPPRH
jgi:diguanylate cyclase (GGDEF)-like protein/PAS domain S-box-containing protein